VFTELHLKVLRAMLASPSRRGSRAIAGDVGIGVNKTQGIINNLKDLGMIESKRVRDLDGTVRGEISFTELGYRAAAVDKATIDNSSLIDSSYLLKYTEYIDEVDKEKAHMTYFEFAEDREEAARRERERKHREKQEAQEKKAEERRMKKRDKNNPSSWTITDTAFEFAEQMHKLWHVKPWRVTTSRFRVALAKAQAEFGTSGPIEKVMIDLYFKQIKHNTSITDPEHVWKRFIAQYGSLMIEAERQMVTPDDIQQAKEKSMKSRGRLRDV